ncbi:hypothetical protein L210DRAFT_3416878, partial [Boletus edulis BED1]
CIHNDSALRTLSELLRVEQKFSYNTQEHCIRCFPHIINLCVQHMLNKYTEVDFSNVLPMWVNDYRVVIDKVLYVEAVQGDPMGLGRNSVSAIRVSGQHHTGFIKTIANSNKGELEAVRFPTVFRIAMDFLPIQASAMLCEQVFSSSTETDMKKRNWISPLLMEALQMLKFARKQDHINFTDGWITSQKDMLHVQPEGETLPQLIAGYQLWNQFNNVMKLIVEQEGNTVADCMVPLFGYE